MEPLTDTELKDVRDILALYNKLKDTVCLSIKSIASQDLGCDLPGPKPETRRETREFFFFIPRKLPNRNGVTRWYWFTTRKVECIIDHKYVPASPEVGDDDWREVVIPSIIHE